MSAGCRLLPFTVAGGPWQMAADEVLLGRAGGGIASLRFYGWPEATLSLGYFQPAGVRLTNPRLAALPWVRRPSGGGALVHHHEVTYALALPAGPPWQPPGVAWSGRMHEVITAALAGLGVRVRACAAERGRGEVLCFLHHTPGDLLVGQNKVVGSAQRRHRGALMQHGSILLGSSPATPELPGIAELAGRGLSPEEVCAAVAGEWRGLTGLGLEPAGWAEDERRQVDELAATKYATPRWNEKR
jgi:lipoyl(octanoyl) transferase